MPDHEVPGFVAVHVGAGFHSEVKDAGYKETMRRAVQAGMQALAAGASALAAVVAAISVLEDCPLTNAGYGSNLTRGSPGDPGHVECDASVMAGAGRTPGHPIFGGVGAALGAGAPSRRFAAPTRLAGLAASSQCAAHPTWRRRHHQPRCSGGPAGSGQ